jgi:hypothetical protein
MKIRIFLASVIGFLALFISSEFIGQSYAQVQIFGRERCGLRDYDLDVKANYDRNKARLDVTVVNPKPLLGRGDSIYVEKLTIYVYDGTKEVAKKKGGNYRLDPGDSKSFNINNVPTDIGIQTLTVLVKGDLPNRSGGALGLGGGDSAYGDTVVTIL